MGIKQIAKLANVSIGTVDRVLHNRSGVSKETEQRVLKIIKETGYTKNTTASRLKLASVKKIKIAVLIPKGESKWSYWKLPKKGITKAVKELSELGVKTDFYDFFDSHSFVNQSKEIFRENYDAIVTVPFFRNESNDLLRSAKSKKIPIVFIDTEVPLDPPAHFIRQNSSNSGMVAGRLLHCLVGNDGEYYVVNMLNDKGIHANNKQREDGFKDFFKSIDAEVSIQTINYSLNDEFKVTDEMKAWFGKSGPKGIFVTNSKSHLLPQILKQHNVQNAYIVGFDVNKQNLEYLKSGDIDFLINQKPEYQGYASVKSLFNFLTKKDTSELDLDIPVEIIVKENCPALD